MELEQDLQIFGGQEVVMIVLPDSVDDPADGGLGDPGHCLGERLFDAIEDVPTVAELVLDEPAGLDLVFDGLPVGFYTRMSSKVNSSGSVNFMD